MEKVNVFKNSKISNVDEIAFRSVRLMFFEIVMFETKYQKQCRNKSGLMSYIYSLV